MKPHGVTVILLAVVFAGSSGLAVPVPAASGDPGPAALGDSSVLATLAQGRSELDDTLFAGLKWRSIGPANHGGRTVDFAVALRPEAPDVIYAATASGGLWASSNEGTTWEPVFDEVDGLLSIGDVAVAPSNPNIVWVGTGEANNRQSSPWGDGVYVSVDGARSWQHVGLKETRHVGRIVIHPTNPDVVYVAAVGHLWGPNEERGVYRTTDGGESWEKVLYVDQHTGAVDLVMDPLDPKTLLAAMYQRQRSNWGFAGGGPGSGLYRTVDGGESWEELTEGLPEGEMGRIGLAIYPKDPRLVYAIVEADPRGGFGAPPRPESELKGGVFRSTDRGESWEQVNTLNPRPSSYSQIRVDPNDPHRVYVLGQRLHVSDDGGRTFTAPLWSTWIEGHAFGGGGVHPDNHALWIDPRNSNRQLLGNDGGVMMSWDRGETWRFIDNLPIGQFYEIGVDMRDPYYVCGGLQDNGSWCVPSATRSRDGITNHDVYNVGGGDGFNAEIDPNDHTILFLEWQGGRIYRLDLTTMHRQQLRPMPKAKPEDDDDGYRWNWNTPIVMSTRDPATIYVGSNHVHRSTDRGVTWEEISPDLTSAIDRDELEIMGRKVTDEALSRHDGVSSYGNLTTVSESPLEPEVLYTGSDDGQVHLTRDGGANWTNITDIPGLPPFTYVSGMVVSAHAPGRVYATFDGHANDDYKPYVYVSDNYGRMWRSLTNGLPEETSVNVIQEHHRNPNLLFVGHEKGVHVSIDRGESWASLNNNLPPVPVDDLVIHPRDNDLIVGTHGRSIWILDDIGPLEALTEEVLGSDGQLLPGQPARLFHMNSPQGWFGRGQFFAPNPDYGARITYYLREAADEVEISIRDASGEQVRKLEGSGKRGINRVTWDLLMEPPFEPEEGQTFGYAGIPSGPPVLPGDYSVQVTVRRGGSGSDQPLRLTGNIVVGPDPEIAVSDADRRARHDALLTIRDLQRAMDASEKAARRLKEQLDEVQGTLAKRQDDPVPEGLGDRLKELADQLEEIQDEARDVQGSIDPIPHLGGDIREYEGAPRPDERRALDWAFEEGTELVEVLNGLIQSELPSLYEELNAESLWPPRVPTVSPPRRASTQRE